MYNRHSRACKLFPIGKYIPTQREFFHYEQELRNAHRFHADLCFYWLQNPLKSNVKDVLVFPLSKEDKCHEFFPLSILYLFPFFYFYRVGVQN